MKQVLYFSLGAIVGSGVTLLCVRKHYAKKADAEISAIKEAYGASEDKVCEDSCKEDFEEVKEEYEKIIDKNGYNEEDDAEDSYIIHDEYPREERASKPYVIGPDLYSEDFHGFDKCVLVYWRGNDMLLTDEQEIMDIETTIGRSSLEHFGEYESDTVFVRNERLGCDFEVLLEEGSYAED